MQKHWQSKQIAHEAAVARTLDEQQTAHEHAIATALAEQQAAKEAAQARKLAEERPVKESSTQIAVEKSDPISPPLSESKNAAQRGVDASSVSAVNQGQQPELSKVPNSSLPTTPQLSPLESGLAAYYAARYSEALRLLKPLAEAGNPRAQFRLVVMYATGRGVDINPQYTREWLIKSANKVRAAAAQGDAWAQADLGAMYESRMAGQQGL